MEAIAVGDLHLTDSKGKGGLAKYLDDDADAFVLREFQKACDYARKKHIKYVIQAGDVCESPVMSQRATLLLIDFIKRNEDLTFFFISGNHDSISEDTSIGNSLEILQKVGFSNAYFFTKPKSVKFGDAKIRFLPWPSEDFDPDALNIYHKEVRGALNDGGRAFDSEDLPASQAVTVAGHLHTSHRVRNTWYIGTLYQTNFGEKAKKYFGHIRFNSAKDFDVELIPTNPEYTLHNVILESRDDLKNIPTDPKALVKLIIQDGADVHTADYSAMTNIVQIKNFGSRADLQQVLAEEFAGAEEVSFDQKDFLVAFMDAQGIEEGEQQEILALQERIRNANLKEAA
jgi:DNA repair exonuclease SbcCD nuclease subunit